MSARRNLIFAEEEVRFLRELVRAKVDFMIVGLSAAALQGAVVVTQDVDLWFRDMDDARIRKALRRVKAAYVSSTKSNPPVFVGRAVQLFDIVMHMHGLGSFEEERQRAIKVPLGGFKVAVLPLERIIASKRALGRPKDKLVLRILSDTRRAVEARSARRGRVPARPRRRRRRNMRSIESRR